MNMQMVESLFILFSGEEDSGKHLPFLKLATGITMKYVNPNANSEDIRLCYLAASIANWLYSQSSAKAVANMNMPNEHSNTEKQVEFAKQLIESYCDLCVDLLINIKDITALY